MTAEQAEVRRQALARRNAGEFPWQIAEDLGITGRQLQDWLRWAEGDAGIGHGARPRLSWLSDEETNRRRELLARWHQGETARDIAADLGFNSRQVRQWIDWAKQKFPPPESDYAPGDRMTLRRRRMLEARNAGRSVEWIAKRWGVSLSTADNDVRRARADAKADAVGWGPPAEPLLDWLRELPLDAAGWARHELLSQAASAMGHPVDFRHLLWKLRHTEWRCDAYLYRVDDAQEAGRRFRLALLERRQGINLTGLELAAEYGTSVKQIKAWLTAARRLVGQRVKGLPRGSRPDYGKRRRALEMRNRGCSDAVVAQVLGVSWVQAGSLVRGGQGDALRTDVAAIAALGPVAEPLRDWLRQLPADWAGMDKQEFHNRASLAMGYPVYTRGVG